MVEVQLSLQCIAAAGRRDEVGRASGHNRGAAGPAQAQHDWAWRDQDCQGAVEEVKRKGQLVVIGVHRTAHGALLGLNVRPLWYDSMASWLHFAQTLSFSRVHTTLV